MGKHNNRGQSPGELLVEAFLFLLLLSVIAWGLVVYVYGW